MAEDKVSWIEIVSPEQAEEAQDAPLLEAYREVMAQNPHGKADNVMRVHSLRPATMLAHLKLYKSTLHNPAFTLPFVFLEAVYAMVSHLNGCTYAWTHHSTNMANLRGEDGEGAKQALLDENLGEFWEGKELALLLYAKAMTVACADREGLAATFQAAKSAGANDGEMLEINQVVGYCNYANRTLNGLGVSLAGDTVGFYKEGATESEGGQRGAEKL